jgi:hypothetical protein
MFQQARVGDIANQCMTEPEQRLGQQRRLLDHAGASDGLERGIEGIGAIPDGLQDGATEVRAEYGRDADHPSFCER